MFHHHPRHHPAILPSCHFSIVPSCTDRSLAPNHLPNKVGYQAVGDASWRYSDFSTVTQYESTDNAWGPDTNEDDRVRNGSAPIDAVTCVRVFLCNTDNSRCSAGEHAEWENPPPARGVQCSVVAWLEDTDIWLRS